MARSPCLRGCSLGGKRRILVIERKRTTLWWSVDEGFRKVHLRAAVTVRRARPRSDENRESTADDPTRGGRAKCATRAERRYTPSLTNALSSEPIGNQAGKVRNLEIGAVTWRNLRSTKQAFVSVFRQSFESPTTSVGKWLDSLNSACSSRCRVCQWRSFSARPKCQWATQNGPSGESITAICARAACGAPVEARFDAGSKTANAKRAGCHSRPASRAHSSGSSAPRAGNAPRTASADCENASGAHCGRPLGGTRYPGSRVRSHRESDRAGSADRDPRFPYECCNSTTASRRRKPRGRKAKSKTDRLRGAPNRLE